MLMNNLVTCKLVTQQSKPIGKCTPSSTMASALFEWFQEPTKYRISRDEFSAKLLISGHWQKKLVVRRYAKWR